MATGLIFSPSVSEFEGDITPPIPGRGPRSPSFSSRQAGASAEELAAAEILGFALSPPRSPQQLQEASTSERGGATDDDSHEDTTAGLLLGLKFSKKPADDIDGGNPRAARRQLKMATTPTQPFRLKSSASVHTLKVLAAAFQICSEPDEAQLEAVSRRVGVSAICLSQWWSNRRKLEACVRHDPVGTKARLSRAYGVVF